MHTKPRLLACAILATSLALLAACTRPAISTPQANDLATSTLTATPTITASETTSSTATRRPTRTPHPTRIPSLTPTTTPTRVPGPAQSFLYTQDGVIWRYAFQNWSAEKVTLPAKGYISRVASNTTGEYLAYWDEDGLKLSQRPFASFTLLATTPAEWGNGLVFNETATLLAYTDAKGLHTYDLKDGSQALLLTHDEEPEEGCKFYYAPYRWAPDDRWLAVETLCYEGGLMSLFDRQTQVLYEFPTEQCPDELSWDPNSGQIAFNVYYSGYRGCGEQDGIYVLSTPKGNPIENTRRMFSETTPADPWERDTNHAHWHPDGKWISFVQTAYPETDRQARLLVVKPDGSQLRELASAVGYIINPFWSQDGSRLFYTIETQEISSLHSVVITTWEERRYGEIPDSYALTLSPDSNWLILDGASLWLMNVADGKIYETELPYTAKWLGWEIP